MTSPTQAQIDAATVAILRYVEGKGFFTSHAPMIAEAALTAAAQVGEITGETIGNMSVRKFQDQQLVAATIERCAQIVDKEAEEDGQPEQLINLAAAIRALSTERPK